MYRHACLLLLLVCGTGDAAALFEEDSILEVTLEGPFSTVFASKAERQESPFALTVDGHTLNLNARVRGISRLEVCRFPPLRLDFSTADAAGTIFAGQRRLKLVTHCKNSKEYEQNVLEEYAAYRLFNVLSDVSFRVRLLRIRYIDTSKPEADAPLRYAFVIESEQALAARRGLSLVDTRRVAKNYLDQNQAGLAYVFQYLIGNTDWALVRAIDSDHCCHNGVLVGTEKHYFYVPYDFDRAGIVNARYAKPDPTLRIRRVTHRRYRGYCMASDTLRDAFRQVVGHRDDIVAVLSSLSDSTGMNLDQSKRFVQAFFDAADAEQRLLKEFERRCL